MWMYLACVEPPKPAGPDWEVLQSLEVDNVVLLHVDTLRADRLPWYGYGRLTFPLLEEQSGWLALDEHIAAASWTFPSTASLLSSLRVAEHGIIQIPELGEREVPGVMWQEAFADAGLQTAFFNGNGSLEVATDVESGWDHHLLDESSRGNMLSMAGPALDWIDTVDGPFFLMMQPIDPHRPWQPMEEDQGIFPASRDLPFPDEALDTEVDAAIRRVLDSEDPAQIAALKLSLDAIYDEELRGLDRGIAEIFAGLDARGLRDRTLVILTADHGESLLDDGKQVGHNGSLRRELVHVPLVFFHPDLPNQNVAGCPTDNIDLLPTVAEVLRVPAPAGMTGRSFGSYGCRGYGVSTLFQERSDVELQSLSIDRPELRIVHDCPGSRVMFYDLRVDPTAAEVQPLDRSEAGLAWLPFAQTERDAVLALWPELSCDTPDYDGAP